MKNLTILLHETLCSVFTEINFKETVSRRLEKGVKYDTFKLDFLHAIKRNFLEHLTRKVTSVGIVVC